MRVVLVFNWRIGRDLQDELWKMVDFPCMPPVGASLFLNDCDLDIPFVAVAEIEWAEYSPQHFHVKLEVVEFKNTTVRRVIKRMKKLGWSEHIHMADEEGVE